jgi:hypothetical protein
MADAYATVQIGSSGSGSPSYLGTPREVSAPSWPSGSIFGTFLNSVLTVTVPPRRETVFLTRSHQRIMDRALRQSLRIIA